jgi:hypothetical protein
MVILLLVFSCKLLWHYNRTVRFWRLDVVAAFFFEFAAGGGSTRRAKPEPVLENMPLKEPGD